MLPQQVEALHIVGSAGVRETVEAASQMGRQAQYTPLRRRQGHVGRAEDCVAHTGFVAERELKVPVAQQERCEDARKRRERELLFLCER